MEKRISSRAVIIRDGKLLLMFRRVRMSDNSLKEFYVTPGGGVENNENLEESVVRELKEEMHVDIKVLEYLGADERDKDISHFYKAEIINGEPKLFGEELERSNPNNYYEPMWIDVNMLETKQNVYGLEFIYKALNGND